MATSNVSYVEWGAVIAGTVLATAISAILLQFGSGLGLSASKEWAGEPERIRWLIIASGLWLLWVQVTAAMAGGYLAGRMRRPLEVSNTHESEVRDGAHGLLVWASGTVVTIAGLAFMAFLAALAPQHAAEAQAQMDAGTTHHFAKVAGLIFGFGATATSMVAAVAAWWAATLGGDHRDRSVDFSRYLSFRVVRR